MKFSLIAKLSSFASKLMGISVAPANNVCASNITEEQTFLETVWIVIKKTFTDAFFIVWEMVVRIVYVVTKWMLTIIDFLFIFIREMIGMNKVETDLEKLTESDMIFKFVFNDRVRDVIRYMIGFGIILLVLFTIFAIIKSEYDYAINGGNNSKSRILVSSLKSIMLMALVPIICVGALLLSNGLFKAIYIATAGGADTSLGTQIFVSSAYNSNAYRRYADNNLKIPITFNFEEIGPADNINGWGTEGGAEELDAAYKSFRESSVWNRGLVTFLMFYTDSFDEMDMIDALNKKYKDAGKTSAYHDVYDKGILTNRNEYYVMADVIDYSIKNTQPIYFKTMQEIYESWQSAYNKAPNQVSNYCGISRSGGKYKAEIQFTGDTTKTKYEHTENAKDESKGAVFMIAIEKTYTLNGKTYSYFYPLLSAQNNFATDYYEKANQPVIARGIFEKGENPTAIKSENGVVKFYRDKLNIPTLLDFFPTISYEKPEGVTENLKIKVLKGGIKALTGVNIDQMIPYVYYSFDIFNLFAKMTYNIVTLDNGYMKLDYNFRQSGFEMDHLYNLSNFNILILIMSCVLILPMLLNIIFGLGFRVLDMVLLAITYPAVLSTYPIDNGGRFKGWTQTFVEKLLSIYGVVLGVNLVLMLLPTIDGLNLITPAAIENAWALRLLPKGITATFLNNLVTLLFTLVALSAIKGAGSVIEGLVQKAEGNLYSKNYEGGIVKSGAVAVNDLKMLPSKVGNLVSGKAIIDAGASLAGFIPGSAVIGNAVGTLKHFKNKLNMSKDISNTFNSVRDTTSTSIDDGEDGDSDSSTEASSTQEATQSAPAPTPQSPPTP